MLGLNLGRYGMVSGVNLCEAVALLSADPLLTFLAAPSRTALELGLLMAALCEQHGVLHAHFISMAGGLDVEEGMAYTDRPGIDHVVNPGVLCFGSSGSNIR